MRKDRNLNIPPFVVVCHAADLEQCEVIDSYSVGSADVFITKDGRYMVSEPKLSVEAHTVYDQMMQQLFLSLEPLKSGDPVSYIETHIWDEAKLLAITDKVGAAFSQLKYYLVRDVVGYGILDVLMRDENIEEITCERFDRVVGVIHRKYTEFNILDTNIKFGSAESMNSYIQKIIQRTGGSVTAAFPIVNAMTAEGDRITATYESEVSFPGPTISIRRFARKPFTIVNLLEFGTLDLVLAAYLWLLLDAKAFGLIVGETGSGKTTIANALMVLTNPRWKILTIEETPELKIPHYRWERLFTRTSPMITQSENYDITMMDLIKASLRMRPDFEIVGEVRGQEAQFLFQSAATGHGGLTTFHASNAESALKRLSSEPINIKPGQQMLLWFIAHVTRLRTPDKKMKRKIVSIEEVLPGAEAVGLLRVFEYDKKTDSFGIADIDELAARSVKVHLAANVLGVNLGEDLQKRITLLHECRQRGLKDLPEIVGVLSKYYT
ncbi:MAG: type II/IV secretion system ATPase subunit [Candidatus Nitrosotenuis sp.]